MKDTNRSCCSSVMATSLDDLKSSYFWRGLFAEALGTLLLVLIGCGSCVGGGHEWETFNPTMVQISLCFGLSVATVVWCIAHISGGHINPAVTMGMLFARRISIVRAVLYIIAQSVGAIAGAEILKGLTPAAVRGDLGVTRLNQLLTKEQGFGVEFMVTFILVLTVFSCCDSKRTDLNGSAPLTIGLSVSLCHLFAIKYTGSSMNPARSLGPAVAMNIWQDHWVYWCGPMLGGIFAGLLYDTILASDASLHKARGFCLSSRSQEDDVKSSEARCDERELLSKKDNSGAAPEYLKVIEAEACV